MTSPHARVSLRLLLVVLAAAGLAACETSGLGTTTQAPKPVEPPMTHRRAAELCWMAAEKGSAAMPLDKRADVVDKCIAQKMKAASGSAAPAGPEAKRTRPEAGGRARPRREALTAWRRDKPAAPPCGPPAAVSPSESPAAKEVVMAKGQMRVPKEKKKPKADKDKPKQLSAYKLSQQQGSAGNPFGNPPGKKG